MNHISKKAIEDNNGDFVAAVEKSGIVLPEHDELRWDGADIVAVKDGEIVTTIEVRPAES